MRVFEPRHVLVQAHAEARLLRSQADAASNAVRAALALRELTKNESASAASGSSPTDRPSATSLFLERGPFQEQLPTLAAALWSFTVLDIEGTLRRVCRRLLRDTSEDILTRASRAAALRVTACALLERADAYATRACVGIPGEDEEFLRKHVLECVCKLVSGRAESPYDNED